MDDLFTAPPYRPATKPPSAWLDDVLHGRVAYVDAPDAVQSWARLHLHEAAVELLEIPDKDRRRVALQKVPAGLRDMVEAEARRVWQWRRDNQASGL